MINFQESGRKVTLIEEEKSQIVFGSNVNINLDEVIKTEYLTSTFQEIKVNNLAQIIVIEVTLKDSVQDTCT